MSHDTILLWTQKIENASVVGQLRYISYAEKSTLTSLQERIIVWLNTAHNNIQYRQILYHIIYFFFRLNVQNELNERWVGLVFSVQHYIDQACTPAVVVLQCIIYRPQFSFAFTIIHEYI